jgi:hypothetical protein
MIELGNAFPIAALPTAAVGIDESGIDRPPCRIDHHRIGRRIDVASHALDEAAANNERAPLNRYVGRDNDSRIAQRISTGSRLP